MFLFVVLNVETFLNWEMPPVVKTSIPFPSPTFPIPGSGELTTTATSTIVSKEQLPQSPPSRPPSSAQVTIATVPEAEVMEVEKAEESVEKNEEEKIAVVEDNEVEELKETNPVLFYTPDEEEAVDSMPEDEKQEEKYDAVEATSYVPPFNNPVYPNSNFGTFGSVIGE